MNIKFNCFQVNFYKFNKVENGLFSLFGGDLNFLNRVLLSSLYKGNNQIPVFFFLSVQVWPVRQSFLQLRVCVLLNKEL